MRIEEVPDFVPVPIRPDPFEICTARTSLMDFVQWHTIAETVVAEMGWLPTAPSEFLLSRPVSGAFSALWDKPLRLTADPKPTVGMAADSHASA